MQSLVRYAGENLNNRPHIVVLGSCKVGNFVVSTPVLKGLKKRFPDSVIGFVGSDVTADFELALASIDWRVSWDDPNPGAGLKLQECFAEKIKTFGSVELAVNLDGFNPVTCALVPWLRPKFVAGGSLNANLRSNLPWGDLPEQSFLGDPDWDSKEFVDRYKGRFKSNYIAELFCKLVFISEFVDPTEIELPTSHPPFDVPDLLIHCTTARSAKIWPFNYWKKVIEFSSLKGLTVGLVGSPPNAQKDVYNAGDSEEELIESTSLIDLRGKTTLMQLAGAALLARGVISVDAGPLHISAAVGTPTLAILGNDIDGVGASPMRLWMPRCANVSRTVSSNTCEKCADNHFRNDNCLVDSHPCVTSVGPEQVMDWINSNICS